MLKTQCPVAKVIVDPTSSKEDYYLPRHIANGLYDSGEISQVQCEGLGWQYYDPSKRWVGYAVEL